MIKNVKWSIFAIYLIPIFFVQSGLAKFEPWEQVTALWEQGLNPLEMVEHAHFYRFLIAYPGLKLKEYLSEIGFTYYILIFWMFNIALWRRICIIVSGCGARKINTLLFIVVHIAMNGRGAIAWSGWLLCVFVNLRVNRKPFNSLVDPLLLALGLLLSAVTTGVFIVAFSVVLLFFVRQIFYEKTKMQLMMPGRLIVTLAYVLIIYHFASYFSVSIFKNIEFFGNGFDSVLNMMSHGAGTYLNKFTEAELSLLVTLIFLIVLVIILVRSRRESPILIMVGLASLGGIFGFTVLTLLIPLMLIITPSMSFLGIARDGFSTVGKD